MITLERALHSREFHFGECYRVGGARDGVKGRCVRWRRIGKTQTWKLEPGRWEIPVKYGMYEYGRIRSAEAERYHAAEDCPLAQPCPACRTPHVRWYRCTCGLPVCERCLEDHPCRRGRLAKRRKIKALIESGEQSSGAVT